jgi:hypothetical protein
MRRDEVAMSRFSVRNLHSWSSSSFIRSSLLEGIGVDLHAGQSRSFLQAAKQFRRILLIAIAIRQP